MHWADAKHLFEWDGSWRDLYVFDTNIEVWQQLLSALHSSSYTLRYSVDGVPASLPQQVTQIFAQWEQAGVCLSVVTGGLIINCHFFTPEEIEFDIDPREVKSEEAFKVLLEFMRFVGQSIERHVVMTPEGGPESVLIAYVPHKDEWVLCDLA